MTKTINVANIKIGLDVDELKKNGQFTRAELNSIVRTVKLSETPFQKMAKDVALLDRAFAAGGISAQAYNQSIDSLAKKHGVSAMYAERAANAEAKRKAAFDASLDSLRRQSEPMDAFSSSTERATASTGGIIGKLSALTIALSATKAIGSIGTQAMGLAMQKEQVAAQIEVFTKSKEATQKMMAEFVRLDQASSLSATNFQDAAKTMMQFGVVTSDVVPALAQMSEISMGSNERFQSLALAFGQVQASGRLMGQEVLQMVNAGFNPLQEISRTTGKSMVVLRKEMEDGKISAEMVAEAFKSATSAGGQFAGMNEKMAGTTSVKIAKLKSEFTQMMTSIGENEIKPGVDLALDGMIKLTEMAKQKKALTAEEKAIFEEQARLDKKIADQEKERLRVSKERANIEEARMKAQEAAEKRSQEIANSAKSAFDSRIKSISEAHTKAKMGEQAFEEASLKNQADFAMTEGDRMEAESALIQLRETRVITQLRAMSEEYDKITKGEQQLSRERMQREGFTADDIRKAEGWKKAIDAEKERKAAVEEIAKIEQDMMSNRQKGMQEIGKLEKMFSLLNADEQAGKQGQLLRAKQADVAKRFATSEVSGMVANIAPAIKAGTAEAYRFMVENQSKQAEAFEIKRIQNEMLAEAKRANELAAQAPRLQRVR